MQSNGGSVAAQRSAPSGACGATSGGGWQRFGSPGGSQYAPRSTQGTPAQNGGGWNRFGTPGASRQSAPRPSRNIVATPAAAIAPRAGRALRSIVRPAEAVAAIAHHDLPVAAVAATRRAAAAIPVEEATDAGNRPPAQSFRFLPIGPVPFSGGRAVFCVRRGPELAGAYLSLHNIRYAY